MRRFGTSRRNVLTLAGGCIAAAIGGVRGSGLAYAEVENAAETIIAQWEEKPKQAATGLIAKYGVPTETTSGRLIWHGCSPWKCSIVYRTGVPHLFPIAHIDLVEQCINYKVPADKCNDIARFDGSVTVRITRGELAAMCESEAMNYLAVNLVHEIVTNIRSVENARRFQTETIAEFLAGEKPTYMHGFIFELPTEGTTFPDEPAQP